MHQLLYNFRYYTEKVKKARKAQLLKQKMQQNTIDIKPDVKRFKERWYYVYWSVGKTNS